MQFSLCLTILIILVSCSASHNPMRKEVRLLQKGIIKDDTSYVYELPYEKGKSHLLAQGYFSRFSHKERAALDFKMKRGTKIVAARDGIVVRVKEDGDRGGWNRKYRSYGNNIVIQHADSSRAGYWHLQKDGALVNVGDTIKKGQVIALSGKTGYALFPHLHFIVWNFDKNGNWRQIPTRFKTRKGIKYLKPLRRYTKPKHD
ncbi:MAG: M23 family metallopeptidase [Bacteroidetes bacterium]|nr:M23 family metallopeptidase [Bacteroidota bacterium]